MAALMISSQLLLTAFVVYWLLGQYREERSLLHEQLTMEYVGVQDQLVDSMLMRHLIIPSLDDSVLVRHLNGPFENDSLTIRIHDQEFPDAGVWHEADTTMLKVRKPIGEASEDMVVERRRPQDVKIQVIAGDGSESGDSAHAIMAPVIGSSDSVVRSMDITSVISDEERMVRSVRLFISQNPTTFHSDTGVYVYALELDSCMLLEHLEIALEAKDWAFGLDWTEEDPGRAELAKIPGIIIGGDPTSPLPPLRVRHVNAFLVRQIFPQILFGLVLLLLSASAFLFSYRSLLRQLTLNRLRDEFIGNISHELKTPVSTVKIALEALQTFDMKKDPKVAGEYLEMAGKELDRLESLVAKVLHHQMLDNPDLVLEKEPCDLGDLARKVVRTLEIHIREKGARVSVEDTDGPCPVTVDRVYAEGMIMNLIDNSLKYAGEEPEVRIRIDCQASGTSLSVTDNGPGIPGEFRDQVFEKFFRIPTGNRHDVKGYGLGLNFASQVMKQHGGSISFENLPEGGCCFTLTFPADKA